MNIYLVGFSHEAGQGTPGYIRINTFGPRFMVPLLPSTLPEGRGPTGSPGAPGGMGWLGWEEKGFSHPVSLAVWVGFSSLGTTLGFRTGAAHCWCQGCKTVKLWLGAQGFL